MAPNESRRVVHRLLRARDWQDRPQFQDVLDWWSGGGTGVCALTGIGGSGKSAIVERFLQVVPGGYPEHPRVPKDQGLPAPERLFVFSFYDAPSPDSFFAELGNWLAADSDHQRDSYHRILQRLPGAGPVLIVLDGLETVQEDGSRDRVLGRISDGRLRDLLGRVADGLLENTSLLITSRFRLYDLLAARAWYLRDIAVERLEPAAAVRLLRARGVALGSDQSLLRLARDQGLHALGVDLLGGYIARFCGGDPGNYQPPALDGTRGQEFDPAVAEIREQERRFGRLTEQYRGALAEHEPVALAVIERMSLFRLSVDARTLASIFTGAGRETIAGPELASITEDELVRILGYLVEMRLLERTEVQVADASLYRYVSHPAVRDAFSLGLPHDLRQRCHRALSDGLLSDVPSVSMASIRGALSQAGLSVAYVSDPDDLDTYEEAIFHTVRAERPEQAFRIYSDHLGCFKSLGLRHGWYERGERICRCIAESLDDADLPSAERWMILYDDWGRFAVALGQLHLASLHFDRCIGIAKARNSTYMEALTAVRLADVRLLEGRLTEALALYTGAQELSSEQVLRFVAVPGAAFANTVLGNVTTALAQFEETLALQVEMFDKDKSLFGLRGVHHLILLRHLRRDDAALAIAEHNIETVGRRHSAVAQCQIVMAEIHAGRGETEHAFELLDAASEWAVVRDAIESLCWCALVRARILLDLPPPSAEGGAERLREVAARIEDGLHIAVQSGYGIYRVDLLLERARLHLRRGHADAATRDAEEALNRAGDYAWGVATGLRLRAEALLLTAAQVGSDEAVDRAKEDLHSALERWRDLRDPDPANDNFVHPDTGVRYNSRARDTYETLVRLERGSLTDYPLEPFTDDGPATTAKRAEMGDTTVFDVFLSHNSQEKPVVRRLGEALKKRGLTVWLDEWELRPGLPWQDALEEIIGKCRSAAVCVGENGIGPWEDPEMKALLRRFVDDRKRGQVVPIIPVLLPGAPGDVRLPTFLNEFSWVDLRAGMTKDQLDRMQWGITGTKP
jgi:tetratricopeptide (TPR) repeat protein